MGDLKMENRHPTDEKIYSLLHTYAFLQPQPGYCRQTLGQTESFGLLLPHGGRGLETSQSESTDHDTIKTTEREGLTFRHWHSSWSGVAYSILE